MDERTVFPALASISYAGRLVHQESGGGHHDSHNSKHDA
jgi:hypothetical protein